MAPGWLAVRVSILVGLAGLAGDRPARAGAMLLSGDDADDRDHCQGTACGGLYPNALRLLYQGCQPVPTGRDGILAIGVNGGMAEQALRGWNDPLNGGPGAPLEFARSLAEIAAIDFEDYRLLYLPSDAGSTPGGIADDQLAALARRKDDLGRYINQREGRLLALTQGGSHLGYTWLPVELEVEHVDDRLVAPVAALDALFPGSGATELTLSHCCYHNVWSGPAGFGGLPVLAVSRQTEVADPADPARRIPAPILLGGCNLRLTRELCTDRLDNDGDGLVDEGDDDCQVCGDGDLDPGETCDDANLVAGDGCDALCRREPSRPPVLAAPAVLGVECRGPEGVRAADPEVAAWLASAQASDGCAPVVVSHDAPAVFAPGCAEGLIQPVGFHAVDGCGREASASSALTVRDTTPPLVPGCGLDRLAAPRPASRGPVSAPWARVEIACGPAADTCDLLPVLEARILLAWHELSGGRLVEQSAEVPVACGERLTLERLAPPCPSRPPRATVAPVDTGPAGEKWLRAESLVLELRAIDRCGNESAACRLEAASSDGLLPDPPPAAPCRD